MLKQSLWLLFGFSFVTMMVTGCAFKPFGPDKRVITPESSAYVGPLRSIEEHPIKEPSTNKLDSDAPKNRLTTSLKEPDAKANHKSITEPKPKYVIAPVAELPQETSVSPSQNITRLPQKHVKAEPAVKALTDQPASQSLMKPQTLPTMASPDQANAKPESQTITSAISGNSASPKQKIKQASKSMGSVIAPSYSLQGSINVLGKKGEVITTEGTIVTFKPLENQQLPLKKQAGYHEVDMFNKSYQPRFLTINANDSVSFVNKDKIKHNVFSSTGKNAFDLGTFGPMLQRNVQLQAEGIVKVYCNIHPEMASFVAVNDQSISAISHAQTGEFTVANMPLGKYEIRVWNIRGEVAQTVLLTRDNYRSIKLTLDTSNYKPAERKNKFGDRYKHNAALFEDEFY